MEKFCFNLFYYGIILTLIKKITMKITFYSLTIISALLLISFFANQKSLEKPNVEQVKVGVEDDYRIYDKIIREAWAFHKPTADYPNVFKKYRAAFSSVSSPLAIDVFDALKIAIETDSVQAMFEFSETLVKKGCSYRFFERKGLEKLKDYPTEWSKLRQLIEQVQANPNDYWNVELKAKFELLYKLDQEIAKKYRGKNEYGDNWILVTAYQEQVKLPFLKLIKEHGIVGEKDLGVYFRDHEEEDYMMGQVFPGIIILHIIQSGEHSRFTMEEIDLYHKKGYLPKTTAKYIKNHLIPLQFKGYVDAFAKTNEMIKRGASEDSIIVQVREDWRVGEGQ
jgi:hypothetical protein